MELLCDSHHGIYIPQIMARRLMTLDGLALRWMM